MSKFLIHVGYPKAASSFLGEWFHANPSFLFNDFKLLGFNSTKEFCSFALSENDHVKYFVIRDMIFSAPLVEDVFNCHTLNDYQEKICKKLLELFPESKILIVTRGYEAAIKAIYSEYLKQGGLLSFKDFIKKQNKTQWHPFNYSFLIELYQNQFGIDNVLALPYELLKLSPEDFLYSIEKFLNIPSFKFATEVINKSLTPQKMTLLRLFNKIFFYIFFISGPFQKKLFRKYIQIINKSRKFHFLKTLFFMFSAFCKASILILDKDEVSKKYSMHSSKLIQMPLYKNFGKEYFFKT